MTTHRHPSLLLALSLSLAAPLLLASPGSHAAASAPPEDGAISVRRLVVAHDIAEREPVVGSAPITTTQDRVYAFVEARNGGADVRAVRIYFDGPGGRRVGNVTLEVPGAQRRFRTWGYTRYIDTPGTWRALVVAEDGTVLASQEFEVR